MLSRALARVRDTSSARDYTSPRAGRAPGELRGAGLTGACDAARGHQQPCAGPAAARRARKAAAAKAKGKANAGKIGACMFLGTLASVVQPATSLITFMVDSILHHQPAMHAASNSLSRTYDPTESTYQSFARRNLDYLDEITNQS